ncbi:MAG: hypothetical protein ACFFCS_26660 [Candidatus Hodarchaeota archaeon]
MVNCNWSQRRFTPIGKKKGGLLPQRKKNSANTTRSRSRGKVVDRGRMSLPSRITAATPHTHEKPADHS